MGNKFFFKKNKKDDIKNKNKYRFSKRLKHKTKNIVLNAKTGFSITMQGVLKLLIKLKIYKIAILMEILSISAPFVILLFTDNFITAFTVGVVNIFICILISTLMIIDVKKTNINGKINYQLYDYLKIRKKIIVMFLFIFISTLTIIIGHYYGISFL